MLNTGRCLSYFGCKFLKRRGQKTGINNLHYKSLLTKPNHSDIIMISKIHIKANEALLRKEEVEFYEGKGL